MPENSQSKIETLRLLLKEGEDSGVSDYSYEKLIAEVDENINQKTTIQDAVRLTTL